MVRKRSTTGTATGPSASSSSTKTFDSKSTGAVDLGLVSVVTTVVDSTSNSNSISGGSSGRGGLFGGLGLEPPPTGTTARYVPAAQHENALAVPVAVPLPNGYICTHTCIHTCTHTCILTNTHMHYLICTHSRIHTRLYNTHSPPYICNSLPFVHTIVYVHAYVYIIYA
jgi:hypothetical protein